MHMGVGGLADGFRASKGATKTADKPHITSNFSGLPRRPAPGNRNGNPAV